MSAAQFFEIFADLGLEEHELPNLMRIMDSDDNGTISKTEFEMSLRMCSPALSLERLRRRILQRYKSIERVLTTVDPAGTLPVTRDDLIDILQSVDLSDVEVGKFYDLLDIQKTGQITIAQIIWAIQIFSPAIRIEALRDAFTHLGFPLIGNALRQIPAKLRQQQLNAVELQAMFKENLGIKKIERKLLQEVIDAMDPDKNGLVTVNQLLMVLECSGQGTVKRENVDTLVRNAKTSVHNDLLPAIKACHHLRLDVRLGLHKKPGDSWDRSANKKVVEEPKKKIGHQSQALIDALNGNDIPDMDEFAHGHDQSNEMNFDELTGVLEISNPTSGRKKHVTEESMLGSIAKSESIHASGIRSILLKSEVEEKIDEQFFDTKMIKIASKCIFSLKFLPKST